MLEKKIPIKIAIIAETIIHKFHGRSLKITDSNALTTKTNNFGLSLIEIATIAMKDKGIANSRFSESGIKCPTKIPKKVDICHEVQSVKPLPKR